MLRKDFLITIKDCSPDAPAIVRRLLNQIKHSAESFASFNNLSLKNVENFIAGAKSDPQPILDALKMHKAVDIRTLLTFEAANKFDTVVVPNPEVITMTAEETKKSARIFSRGPTLEKKIPYYQYFDTAVNPNSPFRPELIEELVTSDGISDIDKSYFNHGHFEDQLTMYLGDVNLHWLDFASNQNRFNAKRFDASYKLPFIPHTFTSRSSELGRILAVTYVGAIADSEFISIFRESSLDELCQMLESYVPAEKSQSNNNLGVITSRPSNEFDLFIEKSERITVLDNIPGQPNATISLLCIKSEQNLDLQPNLNHQWLFNCSDAGTTVNWLNSSFFLGPDCSMSVSPMTQLKFENTNYEPVIIACFSVRQGEGDPKIHARKILYNVGRDAVSRIQSETRQWFD